MRMLYTFTICTTQCTHAHKNGFPLFFDRYLYELLRMADITDLDVTTSQTPPAEGKWELACALRSKVWLWARRADGGKPITALQVTYDDEVPDKTHGEWLTVKHDMSNGGPQKVWIHYQQQPPSDFASPIFEIKIVTDRNPIAGPGFSKIGHILNPSAPKTVAKEFLCYKTRASTLTFASIWGMCGICVVPCVKIALFNVISCFDGCYVF